jgi:hypothetical protein
VMPQPAAPSLSLARSSTIASRNKGGKRLEEEDD